MRSGNKIATFVRDGELLAGRRNETQFGNIRALSEGEGQRHGHQGFYACPVDLAIALRRMAVPAGEQCTRNQHREEHFRARSKVANVNIASIFPWWDGRKASWFARPDSNHATEWLVRDQNIRSKFAIRISYFVMMQVRLGKIIGEQAEAGYNAVPAPALVLDADDIDLQSVAWFRALDIHGACEWMNVGKIQRSKYLWWGIKADLPCRSFARLEHH